MSEDITIMTDADNPTIFCTEKQLAWNVWQISRGRIDWKLDPRGLTAIIDDPDAKPAFDAAWDFIAVEWANRPAPARSMRELMSMIWDKARENRSFANYWHDGVLAFQPTTTQRIPVETVAHLRALSTTEEPKR